MWTQARVDALQRVCAAQRDAGAAARRDNLNKLAVFLAKNAPDAASIVVPALAANRIEWPQSAVATMQLGVDLADPVLAMLGDIAWRLAEGDAVPPAWIRSLRQRVRRYHNVKV
jgi:hypothetical protein